MHVFCRNPVGNGSAPVIRRAALDVVAFHDKALRRKCWFDESFRQSEDIECWTRIAVQGDWAFGLVDAELTKYRVSNEGLSADTGRQLATWRRFRAKVAIYAPDLDRQAGSLAEAYQLRYLSRRSVRSGKPGAALLLIIDAMRMDQRILRNEPTRTLITLAAAIAGCAVPAILFKQFQKLAISAIALKSIIRT